MVINEHCFETHFICIVLFILYCLLYFMFLETVWMYLRVNDPWPGSDTRHGKPGCYSKGKKLTSPLVEWYILGFLIEWDLSSGARGVVTDILDSNFESRLEAFFSFLLYEWNYIEREPRVTYNYNLNLIFEPQAKKKEPRNFSFRILACFILSWSRVVNSSIIEGQDRRIEFLSLKSGAVQNW